MYLFETSFALNTMRPFHIKGNIWPLLGHHCSFYRGIVLFLTHIRGPGYLFWASLTLLRSQSPPIIKKYIFYYFPRKFQSLDENDDDPQLPHNENSSAFIKLKKKSEAEKELESALILEDTDMEICDPCYCYTKCWLDTVASLFCVSLL